ncbi:shikimate kinase [Campylobacter sp. MIT 99-7217]|uniref:shikimate kinase n=1 Tax=Campylobacter sp. MIT 99-7217 TaxID=535091 RepID=UPI00115B469F|nr:shikimate kinase [Campylobacter sp. MIT 99-7217]TQR34408.1 shikimate kinase [Campylobacter sp. MIT 99-7217]
MNKNIFLIGFMGSGKSTVAKALAKKINYKFLDTDLAIEEKVKLKIKAIFAQKGEQFFRDEEANLALELKKYKNTVIATGGGFHKNLKKDKASVIVYLRADFDYIEERLGKSGAKKRPLFQDKEMAKKLFETRLEEYEEKADLIIDIKNKSVLEIIMQIMKELK